MLIDTSQDPSIGQIKEAIAHFPNNHLFFSSLLKTDSGRLLFNTSPDPSSSLAPISDPGSTTNVSTQSHSPSARSKKRKLSSSGAVPTQHSCIDDVGSNSSRTNFHARSELSTVLAGKIGSVNSLSDLLTPLSYLFPAWKEDPSSLSVHSKHFQTSEAATEDARYYINQSQISGESSEFNHIRELVLAVGLKEFCVEKQLSPTAFIRDYLPHIDNDAVQGARKVLKLGALCRNRCTMSGRPNYGLLFLARPVRELLLYEPRISETKVIMRRLQQEDICSAIETSNAAKTADAIIDHIKQRIQGDKEDRGQPLPTGHEPATLAPRPSLGDLADAATEAAPCHLNLAAQCPTSRQPNSPHDVIGPDISSDLSFPVVNNPSELFGDDDMLAGFIEEDVDWLRLWVPECTATEAAFHSQ